MQEKRSIQLLTPFIRAVLMILVVTLAMLPATADPRVAVAQRSLVRPDPGADDWIWYCGTRPLFEEAREVVPPFFYIEHTSGGTVLRASVCPNGWVLLSIRSPDGRVRTAQTHTNAEALARRIVTEAPLESVDRWLYRRRYRTSRPVVHIGTQEPHQFGDIRVLPGTTTVRESVFRREHAWLWEELQSWVHAAGLGRARAADR